jgi:recombination protein U
MSINYPKGSAPKNAGKVSIKPTAKRNHKLSLTPGNRGMAFEAAINESNEYYKEKGLCLVTKRPTPINIVKVDYKRGAKIIDAYFESQSTTDYNGVYQGHYIDFEAKSTRSRTSFPLANIPIQQIEHLERVIAHGGIAFFMVHWQLKGETYLVPASYIIKFYREKPRASIPYEAMKENGKLIKETYRPSYDYLPVLEETFLK